MCPTLCLYSGWFSQKDKCDRDQQGEFVYIKEEKIVNEIIRPDLIEM